MKIDKKTQEKINELQLLQQTLQGLLLQKQTFQIELQEIESALKELEKSNDEVYKIIGQIMIRSKKEELKKELEEKKNLLNLRIKTLEKQESSLTEKLEKLRKEIEEKLK